MSNPKWSKLKGERLKKLRGKSFEDVLAMRYVDWIWNPAHPHQSLILFEERGYIWVVPCEVVADELILKTLYPSRKYTRKFRKGQIR